MVTGASRYREEPNLWREAPTWIFQVQEPDTTRHEGGDSVFSERLGEGGGPVT